MLRKTAISIALGFVGTHVFSAPVGPTQDASNPQTPVTQPVQLDEVTVTATRTAHRVDKVANTVTVKSDKDIQDKGARDIKDVFADELDVTVPATTTRFSGSNGTGRAGNESINIRGLEGNQILIMEDGIRLPNSFSFGPFETGRGDFLDVDGIHTVEVLRGPASTQYGSDGLGGAVAFRTLAPSDLLNPGKTFDGFVRGGYDSVDRSWSEALAVAGQDERWQWLLLGNDRHGHEVDGQGTNGALDASRTEPNPATYNSHYLLAKAILAVDARNQLGVTAESQDRHQDTEVYSARNLPPLTLGSTLDLNATDTIRRDRFSLQHRYTDANAPFIQSAQTTLYWQNARIEEFAAENLDGIGNTTRDNTYQQKTWGLSTQFESKVDGAIAQHFTYGLDWSASDINALLNGTVPVDGETFPSKPFPDTRYTIIGAFLQDELTVGAFNIIPGVRFDSYKLSPSTNGYTGPVVSLSDHAVSPRLGVIWQLSTAFAPYAQISRGFHAPTPDQVNNGFTNLTYGYESIGNPKLQAEHATSFELGFHGRVNSWRYSLAAYDNHYSNFISEQVVGGSGTPADPMIFQYINLTDARIHGIEARNEWFINDQWTTTLGAAYSYGESTSGGGSAPLDTIQPAKLVWGIRYAGEGWNARANLTHAWAKSADRIAPESTPQFAPSAYTVFNIGGDWKPMRDITVTANLNNLFNEKYWLWSDTHGLADDSIVKDAYTAPGRNAQVSVRYDF
jgi:hemoglobin/transferrin/lactoferrin receptor protein